MTFLLGIQFYLFPMISSKWPFNVGPTVRQRKDSHSLLHLLYSFSQTFQEINHLLKTPRYNQKLLIDEFRLHRQISSPIYSAWLGASLFGATDAIVTRSFARESFLKENAIPDWSNLRFNSVYCDDRQGWRLWQQQLFVRQLDLKPESLCYIFFKSCSPLFKLCKFFLKMKSLFIIYCFAALFQC